MSTLSIFITKCFAPVNRPMWGPDQDLDLNAERTIPVPCDAVLGIRFAAKYTQSRSKLRPAISHHMLSSLASRQEASPMEWVNAD
jgi:hypothetical protein